MDLNQDGKTRAISSPWPLANFSSNLHLPQKLYCTLTTKAVILTPCVVIVNDLTVQFSVQLLSTYQLPKPSCCWGAVAMYLKTLQWFLLIFFFLIGDKWIDLSWNRSLPIFHKNQILNSSHLSSHVPSTCPCIIWQAILDYLHEKYNTFNFIYACFPSNKYLARLVKQ